MRKHARSESKAVLVVDDREAETIGSGAPPLPGSQLLLMPSVGTRRSTRAFVCKNVSKVLHDRDATGSRVLRSGKRFLVSKPAVGKPKGDVYGGDHVLAGLRSRSGDMEDDAWRKARQGVKQGRVLGMKRRPKVGCKLDFKMPKVLAENPMTTFLSDRAFGIVYSRKRRRSNSDGSDSLCSQLELEDSKGSSMSLSDGISSSSSLLGDGTIDDRRFGIAFIRKPRSKKPKLSSGKALRTEFLGRKFEITEAARSFAQKVGILERYIWVGSTDQVVLVALVYSTRQTCLFHFTCFLVSALNGMMKKKVGLSEYAALVSSSSACHPNFLPDVHFLPLRHWSSVFSHRISSGSAGFCIIFGAHLVSVNFAALPSLFKTWHVRIIFSSSYLPNVLGRYQRQWYNLAGKEVDVEVHDSEACTESSASEVEIDPFGKFMTKVIDVSSSGQVSPSQVIGGTKGASSSVVQDSSLNRCMKFRKRGRKRGILRSGRSKHALLRSCRNNPNDIRDGVLKVGTRMEGHPVRGDFNFMPINGKPHAFCMEDDGIRRGVLPSSASFNMRRKNLIKSSLQRTRDSRSAFAESRRGLDVGTCMANVLVTESDRCWREEGATVILELSSSNEWCLAVKFGDSTRFLCKAQGMKPSYSNRYTHAIMWACDSGWKLEFSDKNDWNIFKEMLKECCERNTPDASVTVRIIPIPGVTEISGYEETLTSFMRPDLYIHVVSDEIDRTLLCESACYDMDSGDEDWLKQLNSRALRVDADLSAQISSDNFEKIISAFEKAAYCHPDDVSDLEKAGALCSQFVDRDMVACIFDYWNKKRKQKHSALVRVFQGQPPRKRQLVQKPLLRKRRSFKRQGSHLGRGKQGVFYEAVVTQDAVLKLRAAEAAASRAVDFAVRLRSRAQVLMLRADLAVYKSVMAVRLADAIQHPELPDLPASILG